MSVHTLAASRGLDPVTQAKIHLAAAHRLAALHELDEGIDNHFTVTVPGKNDQFLILPFGIHWSEAKASDMMVFNEAGETLAGSGPVELSARCIHAPIHRITGAKVVLHTHQTWATALNMLLDNRLHATTQTSAFLHGHIAYDNTYTGLADTLHGGKALAFVKRVGQAGVGVVVGDVAMQEGRGLGGRVQPVVLQHVQRRGPGLVGVQHHFRTRDAVDGRMDTACRQLHRA